MPLDAEYKIGRSWAGEPLDDAEKDEAQPVTRADIDEINIGLQREGIEPITGTASPWSTPILIEVPPGSVEFEAILASLSEEDRAFVRPEEAPRGNGHDQHRAENGGRTSRRRPQSRWLPPGARERNNGHQVAFFIYQPRRRPALSGRQKNLSKQFPQYPLDRFRLG